MRVICTPAPVLAMALLGAGCFSELGGYDDCARADCTGTSDGSGGTTGTTASTTAVATTSSTTADGGEVDSSLPTAEVTTAEGSSEDDGSSDDVTPARCGNGVLEPPEQCEDRDDGDPHDGCNACELTPQLVWQHQRDYGDDARDDAVLALAADSDHVQASAVIGSASAFDDAYWFRVASDDGTLDPAWGYMASLAENNRVLALAHTGNDCVLGGFVNGFGPVSIAAGNVLDCDSGLITANLQLGTSEQGDAVEAIRAIVVRGDGSIVTGGVRLHDSALRGWIAQLSPDGMQLLDTTWLDDPFYGSASEVNALALAPDDAVFVAGSFDGAGGARGFAAPLDVATSMPAAFALMENESVAIDVRPLATGMAVAGWSVSDSGESDARVELFDVDGGPPTAWTLDEDDEDRLYGLEVTPDGLVAVGFTTAPATGSDVLVVWLDDELAEQHRAVWNSADAGDDVAWDVVATADGVTIGGAARGADSRELLLQRWVIPPS